MPVPHTKIHFNTSVKCSMTVCNRFNLFKENNGSDKVFKGEYVEHFRINKSFGEISMISRNKWDHHWGRGPGTLGCALHFYFCVPPSWIWLEICWIALQHKKTGHESAVVPVQMEQKLSDFLPVADGGKSERQMEKWLPTCLSSSVAPERKTFDWWGNIPCATQSNRVWFGETWVWCKLSSSLKAVSRQLPYADCPAVCIAIPKFPFCSCHYYSHHEKSDSPPTNKIWYALT